MGDQRHHDAPQSDYPDMEVTDEWRARVRAALASYRKANQEANRKPRDPDRLPDDYASLGKRLKLEPDSGVLQKLLGPARADSKRPKRDLVKRSRYVVPISDILNIGYPTSDDDLMVAIFELDDSYRVLLETHIRDPEFKRMLVDFHRKQTQKRG